MNNFKKIKTALFFIFCSTAFITYSFAKKADNTQHSDIVNVKEKIKIDIIVEDSIVIPTFYIDVKLTPKAEEIIVATRETIIVYFGIDLEEEDFVKNSQFRKKIGEDGIFGVYYCKREINYGASVKIEDIKISKKLYNDLINKELLGFPICFSGQKSVSSNLLLTIEPISIDVLKVKPNEKYTITAKLIQGED
ncbi:MAG: hypothetical protein LBB53_01310 [Prevotellaceae bacterium]|jgi:hypothetical protein|nr:hypothetical protein [Prevotellaceae bacterium]